MTVPTPPPGDHYGVPSASFAYAAQPPSAPLSPPASRPSWVSWTALGLSALSFIIATSVGIIYAADRFGSTGSTGSSSGDESMYDAGLPSWGTVPLTPSGQATDVALTDSLEEALQTGIEDFGGAAEDVEDVFCEALPAPKKDSVGTCSVTVQGVDSTVVLFFTDNDGNYLATLY